MSRSACLSRWLIVLLIIVPGTAGKAQTAPASQPADRRQLMQRHRELNRTLAEQFGRKQYEQAEATARELIELAPSDPGGPYNLACALARQQKKEAAFAALNQAVAAGYADVDHLNEDEDLAGLRQEKAFGELVALIEKKAADAPFEKGKPIETLRTIEKLPEGGLRYRLRLPEWATKEKPARLVIWLHPSGGSGNDMAESLARLLGRQGFALVVFTQKSFTGWSEADATRLLDKTVPDLAKIEGLDVGRPVLMGFSAGGQMALKLWADAPGRFGGLILDAAYPLDMDQYAVGKVAPMALPKGSAGKCPIFILVGEADGGSALWKQVEADWVKAGVVLTLNIVPSGRHEWLFDKERAALLDTWLAALQTPPASQPATQPGSSQPAAGSRQ